MKVKVYWSEHCSQCSEVVEYFRGKQVDLEEVNVTYEQDKFEEMVRLGGIATPFIVIGAQAIHSFDRKKIEKMLEGHK